jgi:hypothetical protein
LEGEGGCDERESRKCDLESEEPIYRQTGRETRWMEKTTRGIYKRSVGVIMAASQIKISKRRK